MERCARRNIVVVIDIVIHALKGRMTATATKPAPSAAQPPAPELAAFSPTAIQWVEQTNQRWRLNAHAGVTPENLETPALWSIITTKLRPFDVVEVVGKDGRWWAEVLVTQAAREYRASVKVVRVVDLPPVPPRDGRELPPGYRIDYDPQGNTYTAFRIAGDIPMTPAMPTWEQAWRILIDHAALRS